MTDDDRPTYEDGITWGGWRTHARPHEGSPSMLVNSARAPSSAFVLIVTYRLPGEHTPPPRQHVMYGDTAAGLALYLEATIHLYPVVGRIVLHPLEAPTDTTPRIAKE